MTRLYTQRWPEQKCVLGDSVLVTSKPRRTHVNGTVITTDISGQADVSAEKASHLGIPTLKGAVIRTDAADKAAIESEIRKAPKDLNVRSSLGERNPRKEHASKNC